MFFRNIVLALGALLVFAGIALSLFWLTQMGGTPNEVKQEPQRAPEVRRDAVLEAVHPLAAGTLIRPGDFRWHEIDPGEARPGAILHKETSETEYNGAIAKRDFAEGEPFTAADLVKTTDRRFLSAVLKPGTRAVTIAVDAPQSSAGMALPGDRVDVVLTQNLGGASWWPFAQSGRRNRAQGCARHRGRPAAERAAAKAQPGGGGTAGKGGSPERTAHAPDGDA